MTMHDGGPSVPLRFDRAGAGPEIVLVHAGIADGAMWEPQWAAWRDRYTLTRVDLRGFGRSGRQIGAFSHARDVLGVLDAVGIDRAALVGASFGGLVALDLAAACPERVIGLVLADPPLPGFDWSEEMRSFSDAEDEALEAGDLDAATEVNVEFWLPSASDAVRAAIRAQQRNAFELQFGDEPDESLLTADLRSELASLDVPALVITGEDDKADFKSIADHIASTLPRARRETIAGAGHLPSLERPAAFDAAVLPFLEDVA
jgi:pimeloyl-ACP methyl ester carboxylesterase